MPEKPSLRGHLELLRIPHLAFSLPFAYAGALIASGGKMGAWEFVFITLAVVGLRSASMAYNDIADVDIDRFNPRTSNRPIPSGRATVLGAYVMTITFSVLFFFSSYMLNVYAFILSPLVWALALSYPYAKRLHPLPHLHLGMVLGLVVFGGAVGMIGGQVASFIELMEGVPWLYVLAVTFWVSGFDVLYALADIDFDRKMRIKSIPAWLGLRKSVAVSRLFYLLSLVLLFSACSLYGLGPFSITSTFATALLMLYQHLLVRRSKSHKAFNVNLVIAPIISVGIMMDFLI